jgi:streptogramin lyase
MMRTLLLFVFALGIIGSTMAQKAGLKAVPYGKTAHPYTVNTLDNGVPNATVANQVNTNRPKSTNATLDTTWIGSSRNIYGSLLSQQRCLWYNHTLNAIMNTHRGNQGITGYMLMPYMTGNDIVNNYSLDQGTTWVKKTGALGVTGVTAYRYPSGVISNPAGNNDINNAYSVMAGPATDGAAWISTFKASVQYDGTHADLQTDPQAMGELLRQGMYATEDGMVHFCGDGYATDYTSSTLMIRNASLNASGTFDCPSYQ